MIHSCTADYFLGANTPAGFRGVFSEAFNVEEGWRAYIIKGGPGTGKSTLMRRVFSSAQERGVAAERVWCSSDPDSLDAVIMPELRIGIFDATAPHVLEPSYPGACEQIVNMCDCWNETALHEQREDIVELTRMCSCRHAQAARMLCCAHSFRVNTALMAADAADKGKLERCARQLLTKHIGSAINHSPKCRGTESKRLLSAVTPRGVIMFQPDCSVYDRVLVIHDRCSAPSGMLLGYMREMLLGAGIDIISCACSQQPERLEHILIPSEGLAFCVRNDFHDCEGTMRILHTERFLRADFAATNKQRLSFNRRAAEQFTALACAEMAEAKQIHDRLEQIYSQAMDFQATDALTQKTTYRIFGDN